MVGVVSQHSRQHHCLGWSGWMVNGSTPAPYVRMQCTSTSGPRAGPLAAPSAPPPLPWPPSDSSTGGDRPSRHPGVALRTCTHAAAALTTQQDNSSFIHRNPLPLPPCPTATRCGTTPAPPAATTATEGCAAAAAAQNARPAPPPPSPRHVVHQVVSRVRGYRYVQ